MHLDAGGPTRSVANSVLACLDAGLDVTLAFPDEASERLRDRSDLRGIGQRVGKLEIFPLSGPGAGLARRYGVSLPLMRYVASRMGEFDVVHLHGAWLAGSLAAVLGSHRAGSDRRRPLVVLSPHETLTRFDLAQSRSPVTRTLKRLGRRTIERRLDAIVYSSELERRDSAHDSERLRGFVVHHPVETGPPPVGPEAGVGDGTLRVGFLGRFHPKKNLAELIRAVARLDGGAATLEVAGMGPVQEMARLRRLSAEAGLGERVRWHGFVDGAAKLAFLRGLDLLAMPSAYECFGMAAAEALASGVPVLVGERVGVAPVVQHHGCGFVVPPRAEAIAGALAEAARDPARLAAMAARAAVAAREAFSFAAHGAALRRAYQELARCRRGDTRKEP
jgi:glycosyltransferase involved in cell wall biosynthesis